MRCPPARQAQARANGEHNSLWGCSCSAHRAFGSECHPCRSGREGDSTRGERASVQLRAGVAVGVVETDRAGEGSGGLRRRAVLQLSGQDVLVGRAHACARAHVRPGHPSSVVCWHAHCACSAPSRVPLHQTPDERSNCNAHPYTTPTHTQTFSLVAGPASAVALAVSAQPVPRMRCVLPTALLLKKTEAVSANRPDRDWPPADSA